ncbi:hypothetical protein INS49_005826 [Diaporthe citri]|uniref:uncharacterized protein n=1 Tax=Diaporthe citri TaxID=83186 RepID=UPI001C7F4159|nr:uncharacterized protein INS49_005826 [Diaporthe citri]KAG6364228.1 hypothetical protein INS49_005826 [Diaporthe citri]
MFTADKTFTFLVIFSIFLLQVAGEAFPTMVVQQNDGVFPNVTNSTGTLSVASPSGTSFISVNVRQEAAQVKHYNDAGNPIDNDEILPGYSKEKRQQNTCHLICTPSSMADICQGSPVFASCGDDCELHVAPPVTPPGVTAAALADTETSGLSKSLADTDDLHNMPAVKSTADENGDAAPDTVIRAGTEIYKPLLEASTGSTMIPVTQEDQVPTTDIQVLPEEKPRPSFYSRLFSRNRPLPEVPSAPGGWIPRPGINQRELGAPFHEDEGIATEYDGDAVDDVQAYLEDED